MSFAVFCVLLLLSAPYGRHIRTGWGKNIPSFWAWIIMELPAVVVPIICYLQSSRPNNSYVLCCLILWQTHYIHRCFIYPIRMRMKNKSMPLSIAVLAFISNIGINYLIFRWVSTLGPTAQDNWWYSPLVFIGALLFVMGFAINRYSDHILRALRRKNETSYSIPYGFMYRFISCPNYLGELLQWLGWVFISWNLAALAFWIWSCSNLIPRALSTHRWYKENFSDYPPQRKAIIPFLL